MDLKHSFKFFKKFEFCTVDVKAYQIGPGYVQLIMQTGLGPMVALQTVTPVEPLVQKVIHRFYAPRNLGNAFFQKFAIWAESVMVSIVIVSKAIFCSLTFPIYSLKGT